MWLMVFWGGQAYLGVGYGLVGLGLLRMVRVWHGVFGMGYTGLVYR